MVTLGAFLGFDQKSLSQNKRLSRMVRNFFKSLLEGLDAAGKADIKDLKAELKIP